MPNEGSYEAALERSNKIQTDIESGKTEGYTMLTGDRPTGRLHLGHYFGTIRERVRLQNLGVKTNIVIADYQVITDRDTTEHIRDNVYNMVIDYLACGIDPEKTMIFTHSAVPAENQLMLPFLSLVTEAELERNPDREGRAGGIGPYAHRPTSDLPGPPGLRHPLLQGQHRARGPRPAAAHRDHGRRSAAASTSASTAKVFPGGSRTPHLDAASSRP
jgi:hypothetical protein